MRSILLSLIVAVSVSLAACASGGSGSAPPAASQVHPAWLTGTWTGAAWETASGTTQTQQPVTVTFAPDGSWKSKAGGSGTSWLEGERVVVQGTAGDGTPIRFTLKQRGQNELWGVVHGSSYTGAAAVSLDKTP